MFDNFEQIEVSVENRVATVTLNRGGGPLDKNSLGQGLRFETTAIRATLASEDYQAGLAAFAERRPPEFPPLTARRITQRASHERCSSSRNTLRAYEFSAA